MAYIRPAATLLSIEFPPRRSLNWPHRSEGWKRVELNPRICPTAVPGPNANAEPARAEIRGRARRNVVPTHERSSYPHFSPLVPRNSLSEKIFQQRRRRNGTLIRVRFVPKLRREKWQFITFISPLLTSPPPRVSW